MATDYKLYWLDDSRRWRKRYRGRTYYFPAREEETKEASYRRAWQEWLAKKAEEDAKAYGPRQTAWEHLLDMVVQGRELAEQTGNRTAWNMADSWVRAIRFSIANRLEMPEVPNVENLLPRLLDGTALLPPDADPKQVMGPQPWEIQADTDYDMTIGGNAQEFIRQKARERSAMRADSIERAVNQFVDWIGAGAPVSAITETTLDRYRDHLEEKSKQPEPKKVGKKVSRPWSAYTLRDYLAVVKQFVRWLWSRRKLENLPRNIEEIGCGVQLKAIQTMRVAEVKAILKAAPETLRLHLLLMLNCGMLQQDISDLRLDEVDWRNGRISRKRSKTKQHEGVPVVEYPLWPKTFSLLKKHRSDNPEHVLLNSRGGLLREDKLDGGKLSRIDSIRTSYRRLCGDKLSQKSPKPLKLLRKSASSLLAAQYGNDLATYFLGHSPRTVAEKHYIAPDAKRFAQALDWLRKQFGQ